MRTRRFLAAAVLAALPLVAGALDATPARGVIERPDDPRWLHALGVDWRYSLYVGRMLAGCRSCPLAYAIAR